MTIKIYPIGLICILLGIVPCRADDLSDASSSINTANQLLRDGDVEQALAQYQSITSTDAVRDTLAYNQAVAMYRKGDFESAAKLFLQVAGSGDASLAGRSRYNAGNCRYGEALAIAEADKQAAIAKLSEAIGHYRGSLRSDRSNTDARANIELAAKLIAQLEEQSETEQQQEQQQQDQENQSKDSDSEDSQSSDDKDPSQSQQENESEENNSQQQDAGEEGAKDEDSSEGSQGEQSSDSQETSDPPKQESDEQESQEPGDERSSNEGDESDSKPQSPENSPANSSPANKPPQESADSSDGEGSNGDATESGSETPQGELTADNKSEQQPQTKGALATEKDSLMDRQEAMKMLQSIRDRDMLRRFQLQQRERRRYIPVDRDW